MEITILGTGTSQGVPIIGCDCEVCSSVSDKDRRLRCSVYITVEGKNLLIDCGPDFRQQMLRENICKLDAILITHEHKDHTSGLDEVRSFNFLQRCEMPVYSQKNTLRQLENDYHYAFDSSKTAGVPRIKLIEVDSNKTFQVEGLDVIPLPLMHKKLPIIGFRIGDFSYVTDANFISDDTLAKMQGTKILIINALQIEHHPSHFNLEEAIATAKRIGSESTYFTHISHKLGLHEKVERSLPKSMLLAYDGLKLSL